MWFLEDLSIPKILLVLFIALLLFGPRKLPELGSSLGQAIKGFKHGLVGDGSAEGDIADGEKAASSRRA
jgi:sec-independent protein translocase protein TatA